MNSHLRRIVAGGLLTAVLTAVSALTGLGSPAQAANEYWVEHYADHTDIVVDWFAVDDVADNPAIVSKACEDMNQSFLPVWAVFTYSACLDWVDICATYLDDNYPGHAGRIGFWDTDGRRCSVIGA